MEQSKTDSLKRTPLYQRHVALGAKLVPFAGWEMPVQYQGIIQEHLAVRNAVGIFDVSHMGHLLIEGLDAEAFVDWLTTADVPAKKDGQAFYTLMCNDFGGTVDDLIVIRESRERFHFILNAANRQKDYAHIVEESPTFDVIITPQFAESGILAVQGPKAQVVIGKIVTEAATLKRMQATLVEIEGQTAVLSRTGYTGEDGFELILPLNLVEKIWDRLLELGKPEGIQPIGLGARDTLRLEMGYALYGHELNDRLSPLESVAAWAVHTEKTNFDGESAIEAPSAYKRYPIGVIMDGGSIPREGYAVYYADRQVGQVTSGTYAPSLEKGIALALVSEPLAIGETVDIEIRNQKQPARVVKLPFWHREE